eukprot:TRINITY_DN40352_c0_g1_i1.p1 TRINITY_DN40352_c0_g1~~TRINITY_DN40352_c0_g1_i1.p1  ORF type:complete len:566 (-),score=43.53 TRINITY_DN40352_c0_g1_i1:317-2014(-)
MAPLFSGSVSQVKEDRVPFNTAEFSYDGREKELAAAGGEDCGVLQLFAWHRCLVKTVQTYSWVHFLRQLQGERFRTSLSLVPPHGKGMRLFGSKKGGCSCGLIWDRDLLDLSDAWIWPSGYFAKSEHNIGLRGELLNGRQEALVTLERLIHDNETLSFYSALSGERITAQVLPFNEVYTYVHGGRGLIGIFTTSWHVQDLLFLLGLRSLVRRSLPAVGDLPVFVLEPLRGACPVGRALQRKLLLEYSIFVKSPDFKLTPVLPLDVQDLGLGPMEQIWSHCYYGLTEASLSLCVSELANALVSATGSKARAIRSIILLGLSMTAEAGNGYAAKDLVRVAVASPAPEEDYELLRQPLPTSGCLASWTPVSLLSKGSVDFCAFLHELLRVSHSPGVNVAIGASIALDEFASRRMSKHIAEACAQLEDWLSSASSTFFRIRSWRELSCHSLPLGTEPSSFSSFLGHKAEENRKVFHDELAELQGCHDVLQMMAKLCTLVEHLRHPCLRLEMLQHILGLDKTFDLEQLMEVVQLAFEIVSRSRRSALTTQTSSPTDELQRAEARMDQPGC